MRGYMADRDVRRRQPTRRVARRHNTERDTNATFSRRSTEAEALARRRSLLWEMIRDCLLDVAYCCLKLLFDVLSVLKYVCRWTSVPILAVMFVYLFGVSAFIPPSITRVVSWFSYSNSTPTLKADGTVSKAPLQPMMTHIVHPVAAPIGHSLERQLGSLITASSFSAPAASVATLAFATPLASPGAGLDSLAIMHENWERMALEAAQESKEIRASLYRQLNDELERIDYAQTVSQSVVERITLAKEQAARQPSAAKRLDRDSSRFWSSIRSWLKYDDDDNDVELKQYRRHVRRALEIRKELAPSAIESRQPF